MPNDLFIPIQELEGFNDITEEMLNQFFGDAFERGGQNIFEDAVTHENSSETALPQVFEPEFIDEDPAERGSQQANEPEDIENFEAETGLFKANMLHFI